MSLQNQQQREHGWGEIPRELRERDQWVITNEKRPICPKTGWQHTENQLSFQYARRIAEQCGWEVAFALQTEDPYVVLDFDGVVNPGQNLISAEVEGILNNLGTYTEFSRSGTGLHMVCRGALLPDRGELGELQQGKVEVFDSGQYVVLTGNRFRSSGPIQDYSDGVGYENKLLAFQRRYLPERTTSVGKKQECQTCEIRGNFDLESVSDQRLHLTPEEIRRTLVEFANAGSQKAARALDRWYSSPNDLPYKISASEEDLGFISDLAFWCCEDAQLIDQCFRQSRRMRKKWDEVHYSDGRTYGEATIQTAIRSNYDTFFGHHVRID